MDGDEEHAFAVLLVLNSRESHSARAPRVATDNIKYRNIIDSKQTKTKSISTNKCFIGIRWHATMVVPLRHFLVFSLTLISIIFHTHGAFSEQSIIKLPTDQPRVEKLTHLHFFYHDILEGKNITVVKIIEPSASEVREATGFGTTFMMDNVLTEGPELSSKHVGRAQGLFGLASLEDRGMVMLINLAFSEGEYAGSTLSMLGRTPVQDTVREMPIVGGTGVFRFAKGYAIAKSLWEISDNEHFVVEYHVTVSHP